MPYDTNYNKRIANEVNSINQKFLNHIQSNHMSPYLEYDSNYTGGVAPRGPISNDAYEEVEIKQKGSGILEDIGTILKRGKSVVKSTGRVLRKKGTVPELFKDVANIASLGKLHKVVGDGRDDGEKMQSSNTERLEARTEQLNDYANDLRNVISTGNTDDIIRATYNTNSLIARTSLRGENYQDDISKVQKQSGLLDYIKNNGLIALFRRYLTIESLNYIDTPRQSGEVRSRGDVGIGNGKKKMKGAGFWDDFADSFVSTTKAIAPAVISAMGKPKTRGRPKKEKQMKGKGETFMTPQEKLDKIVSQGGAILDVEKYEKLKKSKGRPKSTKSKEEPKKPNTIEDILNSVGSSKGVETYKKMKGKGKSDRQIGGRKLLLKEEQPPSMMSGNGRKPNKWLEYVAEFRKKHPELKGKELIKKAKESYKN
jgi:hypothetical protein